MLFWPDRWSGEKLFASAIRMLLLAKEAHLLVRLLFVNADLWI
jgi:hypothetical protein